MWINRAHAEYDDEAYVKRQQVKSVPVKKEAKAKVVKRKRKA